MKYIKNLIVISLLTGLYACSSQEKIKTDGYRFVTFENIPRGEMGKVIGDPSWVDTANVIRSLKADSFYVYSNFDSIRMATPSESFGSMFRKTDIRATSWKAKPKYGELNFVGNFTADHLPGIFVSFYFTKDRSSILQLAYTNPGNMTDVVIFHKDSVNILEKAGIVIDPRDEQ
jgi:hypothetical protein